MCVRIKHALEALVHFLQCNAIVRDKTNHAIWQCDVDMKLDLLGKNDMDLLVCKLVLRSPQMFSFIFPLQLFDHLDVF